MWEGKSADLEMLTTRLKTGRDIKLPAWPFYLRAGQQTAQSMHDLWYFRRSDRCLLFSEMLWGILLFRCSKKKKKTVFEKASKTVSYQPQDSKEEKALAAAWV